MKPLVVSKKIHATADEIFEIIAHIEVAAGINPKIKRFLILTDQKRGVGTKFIETRKLGKREFTMEFKVTEYNAAQAVRLISIDRSETTWDSLYELDESDDITNITLTMHCIPITFTMKLMWPLMKILMSRSIKADLDCFAEHLAGRTGAEF